MTLTASRLRSWDPDALPEAARLLGETAEELAGLADEVTATAAAVRWETPAADAARAAAGAAAQAARALGESLLVHAEALRRAASAVRAAQDLLATAVRTADAHGLPVLEDGSVPPVPPVITAADLSDDARRRLADERDAAEHARARAQAQAREALAAAAEADRDAATALQEADRVGRLVAAGVAPQTGGLLALLLPGALYGQGVRDALLDDVDGRELPEAGSDPHAVAAWWASLPEGAQAAALAASADRLGALDGLPAAVRDVANRSRLAQERAALEAEVARLQAALDGNLTGGWFTSDDERLEQARGKLAALERIEQVLALGGRQLVVLDTGGELLTAAVAVGDLDAAAHVAVFTPGFTTTVQGSLGGYDAGMTVLRRQATDLALRHGDGGSVAAVSWLGYEAPQWGTLHRPGRSVATDGAAAAGAARLEPFLDGLDAAREVPPHLTALGHSYGSLTTGLALQRGTGVDDVVLFGSPGIGTDDVRDLGVRPGSVFVVEARRDAVADLAAFGPDPNQLDGVRQLSAAREVLEGVERAESVGHSAYLTDGTTSAYNLAAVVAGVADRARERDHFGAGDVLQWTP